MGEQMTNLTTTLEMSKKLKLVGWSKNTEFYWSCSTMKKYILNQEIPGSVKEVSFISHVKEYQQIKYYKTESPKEWYPAPTITELLEELDNNAISEYSESKVLDWDETVDLFRSPDKIAECWLWASKENLLGRDKERKRC